MINFKYSILFISLVFILLIVSCTQQPNKLPTPHSEEELGKLLFFDSILSRDNQVSCASCHKPEFAFADNVAFSFGVDSLVGTRNTPTVMNLDGHNFFFHDGRAETLEEQMAGPVENPLEMSIPLSTLVRKLNNHAQYRQFFISIYGRMADKQLVSQAIATYQKSLQTSNTAFDDYMNDKDTLSFSTSAKRGRHLFMNNAKCFDCHFGPDFTNDDFKNIGLFNGKELNDSGRFVITRKPSDIGRFKVPSLRNIAVTKPYMHNGSFKTLKEVIEYYNEPDKIISNSINRDTLLAKPLNLSTKDKEDLENFLLSLTDRQFLKVSK